MRKYENQKERQVQEILCNCCGRKIRIEKGMVMEGVFHGQVQWGYFSEKDGESHSFDLCEACYDRLTAGFKIPPEKITEKELL
ncbi:MAG TPA: hypothetical protein H9747_15510 [Candidatus Blautia stercorigallinarum]|uniref:Ribosomal-protein-alanine N-acetyltransferase n=1 Tax=Candidatus Blautia stercorigallinarum TaxID=2838501 RepID=A0A9D1PGQ5_9FIRM|nr:hypothetical protein [Candidatus Blautia stercorigallinarum]